jgi:predicted AAA+ superfamily ATPase
VNDVGEQVPKAVKAADALILFRELLCDKVVRLWRSATSKGLTGEGIPAYCKLVAELCDQRSELPQLRGSDLWQCYLAKAMSMNENAFTRSAETSNRLPGALPRIVRHDLRCLEAVFDCNTTVIARYLHQETGVHLPNCGESSGESTPDPIAEWLASTKHWAHQLDELTRLVNQYGCGMTARFPVLLFTGNSLTGVSFPDSVRLSDLFGYEMQRNTVLENTRRFLRGLPAHNLLLYGDRGTGKSATVKAVAAHYAPYGLRLVQIPRDELGTLPQLLELLRPRTQRFVLFADDLSFQEGEASFSQLKAIVEGAVTTIPQNVIIYATSNRRHFVAEFFGDRGEAEIRAADAMEEKLALADRFGRTVVFSAPNPQEYLVIVEALAAKAGLTLPSQELRHRAMAWTLQENSASPRTAQQFIADLVGESSMLACDTDSASAIMQAT